MMAMLNSEESTETDSQHIEDNAPSSKEAIRGQLGTYLLTLATKSVDTEMVRGDGLDRLSGHLLTSITILSAVYLAPATALFEHYATSGSTKNLLAWLYFICLGTLFIALLLTLLSLVRKKVHLLASPSDQKAYVTEFELQLERQQLNSFDSLDMAKEYCIGLDKQYADLHQKYEYMWRLQRGALILILTSVSFALLGGFYLFIHFI